MNWAQRHWEVLKESVKGASEEERIKRANDNTAFLPAALEVLEDAAQSARGGSFYGDDRLCGAGADVGLHRRGR